MFPPKSILLSELPTLLSKTPLPPPKNLRILYRHARKSISYPSNRPYTSKSLSKPSSKSTQTTSGVHQYQSLAPQYYNSVLDLWLAETHPPRETSPYSTPASSPPVARHSQAQAPSFPTIRQASSSSTADTSHSRVLKRTALYSFHLQNGGKMVPFAGFEMPVQYSSQSIGDSHRWVRNECGLFDVGHMVQHEFSGPGAVALLEQMTPSDPRSLPVGKNTLSVLLHEGTGGIVDDCIITHLGMGRWYVVTNAGCREKDLGFIQLEIEKLKATNEAAKDIEWNVLDDRGLIALQGPKSVEVLEAVLASMDSKPNLKNLHFGSCLPVTLHLPSSSTTANTSTTSTNLTDYPLLISRGGYTGEDGFEISLPSTLAPSFCASLLAYPSSSTSSSSESEKPCKLAGLGARDSLRLEAGMCLYGHDLNDAVTPVEAALGWTVHKSRREPGAKPFNGSETILRQLLPTKAGGTPPARRRVGLTVEGAPAREGAKIFAKGTDDELVGSITSGCPSPTVGKNIAMGYVKSGHHKPEMEVEVEVRGKRRAALVTKMPFLPPKYWKGPVEGIAPA